MSSRALMKRMGTSHMESLLYLPSMLTLPGKEMMWCLRELVEFLMFQPNQVHLDGSDRRY